MLAFIPQIAIGLLVLLGIALVATYFYQQKKKKAPVTAASIPPMPSTTEATQHFATTNVETVTTTKKTPMNRKTIMAVAGIVLIGLVAAAVFFGSQVVNKKKAGVARPHAEVIPYRVCGVNIQDLQESLNGGVYTLNSNLRNSNDYAVDVLVTETTAHCNPADLKPCNDNSNRVTQTVHLEPGQILPLNALVSTNPAGACGSFQNDIAIDVTIPDKYITPGVSCNNQNNPAYGWNTYSGNSCVPGPSQPPAPSATPAPGAACPTVSGLVMELPAGGAPGIRQCPPTGAVGKNGVVVHLNNLSDTSARRAIGNPPVDADGVFRLDVTSLPPGIYNVCADVPTGDTNYCNINRVDGHDPFTTTCAKVDTTVPASCVGNRLVFQPAAPGPSATPPPVAGTSVSGQVFNVLTDRPNQCTNEPAATTHYNGVNGVTMTLSNADGQVTTLTKNDTLQISPPVVADGIFRFNNVTPGDYKLCMEDRTDFYCVNTAPVNTFNTQVCKNITVASVPSTSHRFAIKTSLAPSSTPALTPTVIPTTTTTPGQPTSTPAVRYITATPMPTETVLVRNVTTTPGAGVTVAPTIPSAGVPLPVVVIVLPAILVLLAFLL